MTDEIISGLSRSDMGRHGESPGSRFYDDEPAVDEGTPSALSATDKAHKAGERGPLDRDVHSMNNPPDNNPPDVRTTNNPPEEYNSIVHSPDFAQSMQEFGMSGEAIEQALKWDAEHTQSQMIQLQALDEADQVTALETLRGYWGERTQGNLDRLKQTLQSGPAGLWDGLANARLPSGESLFNVAEIVRFLFDMDRSSSDNHLRAYYRDAGRAESRIAEIEHIMKTNRKAYNRDTALQEELRRLYGRRK